MQKRFNGVNKKSQKGPRISQMNTKTDKAAKRRLSACDAQAGKRRKDKEGIGKRIENRGNRIGDRGRRTEVRRRKTDIRGQMTKDSGQNKGMKVSPRG